ncbi:hypothetical protein AO391_10825 [Pseudomonas marginalis ICMP 9505]|nr:hypothetical protein AO391_10825 [Pseudomonas marginalis ICMP 9505]
MGAEFNSYAAPPTSAPSIDGHVASNLALQAFVDQAVHCAGFDGVHQRHKRADALAFDIMRIPCDDG